VRAASLKPQIIENIVFPKFKKAPFPNTIQYFQHQALPISERAVPGYKKQKVKSYKTWKYSKNTT
jgi:hypothetical protein